MYWKVKFVLTESVTAVHQILAILYIAYAYLVDCWLLLSDPLQKSAVGRSLRKPFWFSEIV